MALRGADCDPVTFWTKMVTIGKFPNLQKVGIFVLAIFGSAYQCECAFFIMNVVKSLYCSRLD